MNVVNLDAFTFEPADAVSTTEPDRSLWTNGDAVDFGTFSRRRSGIQMKVEPASSGETDCESSGRGNI
jgi:hypothetical protein